ncbi:MAG: hydroxypyruvate isomerase family protein [Anaerolineales bacterium]
MLVFTPNVSWLFPDLPFKDRPAAAVQAGFRAIEFGFPSHADLDALQAAVEGYGLQIVLFNQDVPVWDRANRGYLVDPARRDEFRRKLDEALQIARRLSVMKIMLPAGVELPGMERLVQRECMVENLNYAAPLAADAGVLLTIEALNPQDNPGIFLTTSCEGVDIVKMVNHPSVRFQFDTYHIQMVEGDVVHRLTEHLPWIGHIQFADYPGRHEPGSGGIDFASIYSTLEKDGSRHFIGLEYFPLSAGAETLKWVPQY